MIGGLIPESWLQRSDVSETSDEDPRENGLEHNISVEKLEDDGSVYVFCIDRPVEEVHEFTEHFEKNVKPSLPDSHIVVLQGRLDGDVQLVETSVAEAFGHDG